jgi:hypothetical protein
LFDDQFALRHILNISCGSKEKAFANQAPSVQVARQGSALQQLLGPLPVNLDFVAIFIHHAKGVESVWMILISGLPQHEQAPMMKGLDCFRRETDATSEIDGVSNSLFYQRVEDSHGHPGVDVVHLLPHLLQLLGRRRHRSHQQES